MDFNYYIAFLLGLFSTVHCFGMCGGIITALSLGLPDKIQGHKPALIKTVSGYNIGRIISYAIAGLIAGGFGHLALSKLNIHHGHLILQIFAGLILILLGLQIAGWIPKLAIIERAGKIAWIYIQPIGRPFLPVDSFFKAVVIGLVWGWLPCGLVYSVLLWTISSGDPISGSFYMFAFGLGTLPAMITAGVMSSIIQDILRKVYLRRAFAVTIICFGLISPWLHFSMHGADKQETPASPGHQHHG